MKIFNLSCMVRDDTLHDVLTAIEGFVLYDLTIKAVPPELVAGDHPRPAKPAAMKPPKPKKRFLNHNLSGAEFVEQLVAQGINTEPRIGEEFARVGRSPGSTPSALAGALQQGFIVRAGKDGPRLTYALPTTDQAESQAS